LQFHQVTVGRIGRLCCISIIGVVSRLLLAFVVILSLTGCMDDSSGSPTGTRVRTTSTGPLRLQSGVVNLPAGLSTKRFTITARDPSKWTFTVAVETSAKTVASVKAKTSYGARLWILGSTRDGDLCRVKRGVSTCITRFPILEAQHGGQWTIIVRKSSPAPARVSVTVQFE
jgi:hypothetical protein